MKVWQGFVGKDRKASNKFSGIVTRIISPDMVIVSVGEDERKISFSSFRAPK